MRFNRAKQRLQVSQQTINMQNGQNSKHLLPKLKSYSQNDCKTYSEISLKDSAKSKLFGKESKHSHQRNFSHSKQEFNKLGLVKYQYINKSPNYFKKHFKSIQTVRKYNFSAQSFEADRFDSGIKDFDKIALLDLMNNRINQVTTKHKTISVSKNQNYQTVDSNQNPTTSLLKKSVNYQLSTPTSNNKLAKSKAKFDKIKSFIASEKYSKTIDSNQKQISTSVNQLEKVKDENNQPMKNKEMQFFETKYSNFKPNSILNVKSQFKVLMKNSYPKLDLYRFE